MKYTLVSGFHRYSPAADWFLKLWIKNVAKLDVEPQSKIVIAVGDAWKQMVDSLNKAKRESAFFSPSLIEMAEHRIDFIPLQGNCGHVHQLIGKQEPAKPHEFCGWSASVITGAMLAYTNETDFVYLEQDALAFGPVIEKMYEECGDAKMIFGRKMQAAPWMPCAQSLFLIKHEFIPDFVRFYINAGADRDIKGSQALNLPEHKFMKLKEWFPDLVTQFGFGYDRERPIDPFDKVWYAQKFTRDELITLRDAKLISFDGEPPEGLFTSQA